MTKWFYLEVSTTDGEKLQIYKPFQKECSVNVDKYNDTYYQIELDGVKRAVSSCYVFDTEKEALAGLLKSFKKFFKWHSDDRNAPTGNADIYEQKIHKCYSELREKYGDKMPEMFV